MAIVIYNQLFNKIPGVIKDVNFENIILLSENETSIVFELERKSNEDLKIIFTEKTGSENSHFKNLSTNLYVSGDKVLSSSNSDDFNISDFQIKAKTKLQSDVFYRKLFENGNQYGPKFQNIKEIWISNNTALGRLVGTSSDNKIDDNHFLHPSLLDSFTQLLSSLSDSKGRTFILNSINEIKLLNIDLPAEVWCIAKLSARVGKIENEFEGELKVFDSDGTLYIELNGVKFKYLDRVQTQEKTLKGSRSNICIASTFTADPIEDSFKYWNNFFNIPFDIKFAPYNQVFQELLNPQSLLSTNDSGFNIILLGLEDWTRKEHKLSPRINQGEIEKLFKDKSRYTLPNHSEIVHLNKYETEYVFREIFVDKCYLKHGININDGDTIIDIGANIGLFTLFVNQHCKDPIVYSFEPSPVVYDLLKTNSKVYGSKVKTYNYGVSDKIKNANFTFYKNSSVFSSFNPDETEDKEAIKAVVRNLLNNVSESDEDSLEEYVEEMTNGRLESTSYECQLLSVSDIIKENNIEIIDLLKIDAEKSELDIIKGIKDKDWEKIKQIVIEIHDKSGKILGEIEGILKSKGFSIAVEEEEMLKTSGLYNVFARKDTSSNNEDSSSNLFKSTEERLIENIGQFSNALETFSQKSSVPMLVSVTPRSPSVKSEKELASLFDKYEGELIRRISKLSNINTIDSSSFLDTYLIADYYDPQGDEIGHIPYTLKLFSAIGTALYRRIFSIQNNPYKVIALDCDNTLWKGVCGEDGPQGIILSKPYKFLQQFMIDQIQAGMLVCLCSKNNEEDVLEVFKQRKDMLLKTEQLVSWRTNWDYKSINLRSLANELNLGLDNFIFIDDNPVECAEVKANCPDVLTLQLPQEDESIPGFLKNIWSFDHIKVTEEDRKRTKMYQENIQREKYLSSSLTLKDFLNGLNLQMNISQPDPKQLERVSQLTFRTNQFNFTTIRRSEFEIRSLLEKVNYHCLITSVSDRFGDYGLVGVLIYKIENDRIEVDTFLISCRVLGRGVEHKILSSLGSIALEKNIKSIDINFLETKKNRPALDFINNFGEKFKSEVPGGFKYCFPSEFLKNLKYEPASMSTEETEEKSEKKQKKPVEKILGKYNEKIQQIGNELHDPNEIFTRVEKFKVTQSKAENLNYVAPETNLEMRLSEIWQTVLGVSKIGADDNFFEVGGTSLKAVQLIATIKKELKKSISIVTLFECPTIKLLSKNMGDTKETNKREDKFEEQIERGIKRRQNFISRKRN
ncbi:MAG: FkbM family methyltransferase [Ignavibacteriota bacterium]